MSNARYELRPATAADLEFAFQLNRANMRGYVERLGFRIVAEIDAGPNGIKYLMSTAAG